MRDELEKIRAILSALLGRPSRWSGTLLLTSDPDIHGAKPFRCDSVVNETLAGQDARWRTLIHEMLHTFSAGYQVNDYRAFRGWEEGIVEYLQRLLRPTILAQIAPTVSEEVFREVEANHIYNDYIASLETLRKALKREESLFYFRLLETPIRDRPALVLGQGRSLVRDEDAAFVRLFSTSDVTLKQWR